MRRDLSVPRPSEDMSRPSMASTPEAASLILKSFSVKTDFFENNRSVKRSSGTHNPLRIIKNTFLMLDRAFSFLHNINRETANKLLPLFLFPQIFIVNGVFFQTIHSFYVLNFIWLF